MHDAVGLDTEQMQSVAREFNFSETTFLERVSDSDDRVRVRIFTPDRELPFAGHPTVGSAVAVAHENVRRRDGGHVQSLTLDEDVGSVAVEVDLANDRVGFASFILPALPRRFEWAPDLGRVAAVLGIAASDIGFDNHVPSAFDAGLPYFMVPVRDLTVMARLNPESRDWRTVFDGGMNHDSAFVYCREAVNEGSSFHARMFWPVGGIREDPATGSAVASFLGTVHAFEVLGAGTHRQVIEQGLEMGRPSFITLEATVQDGAVQSARIGGNAVRVAHGMLED